MAPTIEAKDLKENAFVSTVAELQGGTVLMELANEFKALVATCVALGQPGRITLTLTVKPRANGAQIMISDKIDVTAPKPEREITLMFANEDGKLSRRDPRQPDLPGTRPGPAEVVAHRPAASAGE